MTRFFVLASATADPDYENWIRIYSLRISNADWGDWLNNIDWETLF